MTIVVVKDNGKEFVLGMDYLSMAYNDKHAVKIYCPQTGRVYKDKTADQK